MNRLAGAFELVFRLMAGAKNIHGERGGESGERRSCGIISRGHEAHDEQHAHNDGQPRAGGDDGEEFVAGCGDAMTAGENIKQDAEAEEARHDNKLAENADNHILLRIAGVAATQVALHHVLVEAVGGNHRKHAGEELLPEILLVVDVVEEEHAGILASADGADQ